MWELRTISYSWLRASAFNKCLLRAYVTFRLPTLKSTCQDGIVPAYKCGHGGNLPLWPRKLHFVAERLPLLPAMRCAWVLASGSNQPPDFQVTLVPDSYLGCLRRCSGRCELALSEGDALTRQPPGRRVSANPSRNESWLLWGGRW